MEEKNGKQLVLLLTDSFSQKIWILSRLLANHLGAQTAILSLGPITHIANDTFYLTKFSKENFLLMAKKIEKRYELKISKVIFYSALNFSKEVHADYYSIALSQVYELNRIYEVYQILKKEIKPEAVINLILKPENICMDKNIFLETQRALFKCMEEKNIKYNDLIISSEQPIERNIDLILNTIKSGRSTNNNTLFKYPISSDPAFSEETLSVEKKFNKILIHNYKEENSNFINSVFGEKKNIFIKKNLNQLLQEDECKSMAISASTDKQEEIAILDNIKKNFRELDLLVHVCDDYSGFDFNNLNYENFYQFMIWEIQSLWSLILKLKSQEIGINKIVILTNWNNNKKDVNYFIFQAFFGFCKGLKTFDSSLENYLIAIENVLIKNFNQKVIHKNLKGLVFSIITNPRTSTPTVILDEQVQKEYCGDLRNYSLLTVPPVHYDAHLSASKI